MNKLWWERDDLCIKSSKLYFAGKVAADLYQQHGSPTFIYSFDRISHKLKSLHQAISSTRLKDRFQIYYAMKANRYAPLLTLVKQSGLAGIDACSPTEVEHAIACGFDASEISYTNTSVSNKDLERLVKHRDLIINCDSISSIRRLGEMSPGREIGIRINPGIGLGYGQNEKLSYSGANTTKFGIYQDQFAEALNTAANYGLKIVRIHFHTGCGYLSKQLAIWDNILSASKWFIEQVKDSLQAVNVGGGLGVPHVESDEILDLVQWANILEKHFAALDIRVEVEPGDFIVKDSGILLLEVNTVEQKRDTTFIGVNAGFNIALEPAVYALPFEPVPAVIRNGAEQKYTIAGNINEALDIWYRDIELSPVEEGDVLVLINAGGYSSSMASNHCMRGSFKEILLQ